MKKWGQILKKKFDWKFNRNITVDKDEENLILLYKNIVNWRCEDKIIVDFSHNKIMKIDIYQIDLKIRLFKIQNLIISYNFYIN